MSTLHYRPCTRPQPPALTQDASPPRPPGTSWELLDWPGIRRGSTGSGKGAGSLRVRCSRRAEFAKPLFLGGGLCPHFPRRHSCPPLLSSALPHDALLCSTAEASERSLGQASRAWHTSKGSASRERLWESSQSSCYETNMCRILLPPPPSTPQPPTFHHRSFREGRHPFPASESESAGERGSAGTRVENEDRSGCGARRGREVFIGGGGGMTSQNG